jgi:hypothetical protein
VYFLIGTPLYFLELSLGQFSSKGTTAAFKMSRMFKGNKRSSLGIDFFKKINL